jgi:putative heme iron utilization protein
VSGHDATPSTDAGAEAPAAPAPSAAEEARTLVAGGSVGTLATLSGDGGPWASVVTYGVMADGAPVLLVSTMAEHGRNLAHDPRASLAVAAPVPDGETLDGGRVTLAGHVEQPSGALADAALAAHVAAVPSAAGYAGWSDFALWILRVHRVRWVGGFARMESIDGPA